MPTARRSDYLFKQLKDMEILLQRDTFTDKSTIGKLYIDGRFECYVLEDKDRGLKSDMPLSEINSKKVYGETAIPYGKYEIKVTMSNRFKKDLPILLNVPGYEGIRIHTGNTDADTHGCLLPCSAVTKDVGTGSTAAFNTLFEKIKTALKSNQKVTINITK